MKYSYLILLSIIVLYFVYNNKKITEGLTSYARCRSQGYSKAFCVQTPTLYWGPNSCKCADGSMGIIHPGLRGECLCSRWY